MSDGKTVTHAKAAQLDGLSFLRGIISGAYPAPSMAATLGFRLIRAESGEVEFQGSVPNTALNPFGFAHGGWFGAILDSALGCAVQSRLPAGQMYTTLEYKINIIRPLQPNGKMVRAVGRALHVGRTTGVAESVLSGVEDGKTYAIGTTTCGIFTLPAG
ncbi:MAG: PaaI family thioesterase [Paracoccaceae bacterium]